MVNKTEWFRPTISKQHQQRQFFFKKIMNSDPFLCNGFFLVVCNRKVCVMDHSWGHGCHTMAAWVTAVVALYRISVIFVFRVSLLFFLFFVSLSENATILKKLLIYLICMHLNYT